MNRRTLNCYGDFDLKSTKTLSADEVRALTGEELSEIEASVGISVFGIFVPLLAGRLGVGESLSDFFARKFSISTLSTLPIQTFLGSLLGQIEKFDIEVPKELSTKIRVIEESFPNNERKAIDEIVSIIRGVVAIGFTLEGKTSNEETTTLLTFDQELAKFGGSDAIISYLRLL